jgi:hypothetical protein
MVNIGVLKFSAALATTFTLSILSTATYGYTDEQQQLCSADAFRLCGSAIPDVDRVTACMIQQREYLSPGCQQFFAPPEEPVVTRKPPKAPAKKKRQAQQ